MTKRNCLLIQSGNAFYVIFSSNAFLCGLAFFCSINLLIGTQLFHYLRAEGTAWRGNGIGEDGREGIAGRTASPLDVGNWKHIQKEDGLDFNSFDFGFDNMHADYSDDRDADNGGLLSNGRGDHGALDETKDSNNNFAGEILDRNSWGNPDSVHNLVDIVDNTRFLIDLFLSFANFAQSLLLLLFIHSQVLSPLFPNYHSTYPRQQLPYSLLYSEYFALFLHSREYLTFDNYRYELIRPIQVGIFNLINTYSTSNSASNYNIYLQQVQIFKGWEGGNSQLSLCQFGERGQQFVDESADCQFEGQGQYFE